MSGRKPIAFSARLRSLMTQAGLSVPDLCARSTLTRQAVHQLLAGRAEPKWETVVRLAEALGVTTDAFRE